MKSKNCPKCGKKIEHVYLRTDGGFKCSCGYHETQPSLGNFKNENNE